MADAILFSKDLQTIVKLCEGNESTRKQKLTVQIVSRTSNSQRELRVRLTSQDDFCLLYTLQIRSDDFLSLKSQQGLLVDFSAFPAKFIDLLELCLSSEAEQEPKFLLQFIVSSSDRGLGTLNVIETNPFKHLTHLSLKLVPGSDSAIKQFLTDCLKECRQENAVLRERFTGIESNLSRRLNQTEEALKAQSSELESVRINWSVEKGQLVSRHTEEMGTSKERALTIQRETEEQHIAERQQMESHHQATVKQLEQRESALQTSVKELTELKYQNESEIHELTAKLKSIGQECERLQTEVANLRQENSRLDSSCQEKDKQLNQLKTRAAVMEQGVKDKEEIIARTSGLLQLSSEQKAVAESLAEEKEKTVVKLESVRRTLAADVAKGNEIILTLKQELKNFKEKFKLKNIVLMKQEQILTDRMNELERQKLEVESLKRALLQRDEELSGCQEELKADRAKLENCQEKLKSNENVISWLNRQINDQYLGHPKAVDVLPRTERAPLRVPLGSANSLGGGAGRGGLNGQKTLLHRSRLPVPVASSLENQSPSMAIDGDGGGALDPHYLTSLGSGEVSRKSWSRGSPTVTSSVKMTPPSQFLRPELSVSPGDVQTSGALQPPIMSSYFPH
eukprot:m.10874 g.10874  ORF g.10874 m.10874 type:complete len:625 (+) comp22752_c0_seq1:352-2226(+)